MNVVIRTVTEAEYRATEHLTREAFWNLYKPGCEEHLILHNLRHGNNYIPDLDLVTVHQSGIIGHAISTVARVQSPGNQAHEVLCLGPISVLPKWQGCGLGSQLMDRSIETARILGYAGMMLFGDPDYYHRFGFHNAAQYGIRTKDDQNFEAFMALELQENSLRNIQGRFYEDDAFEVDQKQLAEFEKHFPAREKGEPTSPIS